jgi:hypothetical protein
MPMFYYVTDSLQKLAGLVKYLQTIKKFISQGRSLIIGWKKVKSSAWVPKYLALIENTCPQHLAGLNTLGFSEEQVSDKEKSLITLIPEAEAKVSSSFVFLEVIAAFSSLSHCLQDSL